MTISQLKKLIENINDDYLVGIHVDGDTQGHSLVADEGINIREEIFWMRATKDDR